MSLLFRASSAVDTLANKLNTQGRAPGRTLLRGAQQSVGACTAPLWDRRWVGMLRAASGLAAVGGATRLRPECTR